MREIKFRFWYNGSPVRDTDMIMYQGKVYLLDKLPLEEGGYPYINTDAHMPTVVVEQYTGLTDKNDVDIYEGDVVNIEGWGRGVIVFERSQFTAKNLESNELFYWISFAKIDHSPYLAEVIGNIHQNPKLLEKDNTDD